MAAKAWVELVQAQNPGSTFQNNMPNLCSMGSCDDPFFLENDRCTSIRFNLAELFKFVRSSACYSRYLSPRNCGVKLQRVHDTAESDLVVFMTAQSAFLVTQGCGSKVVGLRKGFRYVYTTNIFAKSIRKYFSPLILVQVINNVL